MFFPLHFYFCPAAISKMLRGWPEMRQFISTSSWVGLNSPQHIPNIINPDSGPRFGLRECYVLCSVNHFVFFYGLAASLNCEWGKWPCLENNGKSSPVSIKLKMHPSLLVESSPRWGGRVCMVVLWSASCISESDLESAELLSTAYYPETTVDLSHIQIHN